MIRRIMRAELGVSTPIDQSAAYCIGVSRLSFLACIDFEWLRRDNFLFLLADKQPLVVHKRNVRIQLLCFLATSN